MFDASNIQERIKQAQRNAENLPNRPCSGTACGHKEVVQIGVFFDGTGNNKFLDEEDGSISNVGKLSDLYKNSETDAIYPLYIEGVGTPFKNGDAAQYSDSDTNNWWTEYIGGGIGLGGQARIDAAFSSVIMKLKKHHFAKRKDIDIFGFSRGASLARHFANKLLKEGVPNTAIPPIGKQRVRKGYGKQTQWVVEDQYPHHDVTIRFMGIFDTVGSFGLAGNDIDIGYDLSINPNIQQVVHMVAEHEVRRFFDLQSAKADYDGHPKFQPNTLELRYPGAHSDVGGGYKFKEDNEPNKLNHLARIPLQDMYHLALQTGVPLFPLDNRSDFYSRHIKISDKLMKAYKQYRKLVTNPRSKVLIDQAIMHHQWDAFSRSPSNLSMYEYMQPEEFRAFITMYVHDSRYFLDKWLPQKIRDVFYQEVAKIELKWRNRFYA